MINIKLIFEWTESSDDIVWQNPTASSASPPIPLLTSSGFLPPFTLPSSTNSLFLLRPFILSLSLYPEFKERDKKEKKNTLIPTHLLLKDCVLVLILFPSIANFFCLIEKKTNNITTHDSSPSLLSLPSLNPCLFVYLSLSLPLHNEHHTEH